MPRFPSDRTLLAAPAVPEDEEAAAEFLDLSDDNEEDNPEKLPRIELLKRRFPQILKKVKSVLEDEVAMKDIKEKYPKNTRV